MKSILKISNLSHRYSYQWAVQNINIDITTPGIYGLLGANGAGKSTIMNIVCGGLLQTEGEIIIGDIDVNKNPIQAKKGIGYLPQKAPLYLDLTVEEYLLHCGSIHYIPKEELTIRVDEVLSKCNITHFRNRLIKNLSGGYRQRVGIAQAIIHNPAVVILDEPTNGLDPNQVLGVRELIREIAKESTVIMSTHILREVEALCGYIYMIDSGEIVFSGEIDKFYNYIKPNSLHVSFLAQPTTEEVSVINGVTDVEELGGSWYRITYDSDNFNVADVTRISVQRSWRMNELNIEGSSLNKIFALLSKHK